LIEAVPEADIVAREDPDDANGDGISGRAGRSRDGGLGRFGRKADVVAIGAFVETALRFEVGLTTPMHSVEESLNGQVLPTGADLTRDPEIGTDGIDKLTDFATHLAAPPRESARAAVADSIERGSRAFETVGCGLCHVPSMRTGENATAALDRKRIDLYSDLLLHDLGSELADICGVSASPGEWRTAPLWGLRFRSALLMHDGRAKTIRDAILLHGGEARTVRQNFEVLRPDEQSALLRFLASL
jgi:CxxC motif-containing protein (DUF1111 family)